MKPDLADASSCSSICSEQPQQMYISEKQSRNAFDAMVALLFSKKIFSLNYELGVNCATLHWSLPVKVADLNEFPLIELFLQPQGGNMVFTK